MTGFIAVETTYKDGRHTAYRFIEGQDKAALAYANQLARQFMQKDYVKNVRTFDVTEAEKDEIRQAVRKAQTGITSERLRTLPE